MPAKNSIGQFYGRYSLVSKDLWKRYVTTTGSDVTYDQFKAITAGTFKEIQKWAMSEPIGFQMPDLGNIAVNRFKPNKKFRNYINTPKGPIRNHNLHTGGDVFQIRWFHSSSSFKSKMPYWFFKASRAFNRSLATVLKANDSPNFNSFMQDHFIIKEQQKCRY